MGDTTPAPADRLPALAYHQLQRAGAHSWWRSVLGVLLLGLFGLIVVPGVLQVFVLIGLAISGSSDIGSDAMDLLDLNDPTPIGLAYLNLTLAALIPATFLVTLWLHRLRPGWLTSVLPRMRWKLFAACLGLSFVALFATLLVSAFLPTSSGQEVSGDLNAFDSQAQQFALVVLLLTPLQAAGEEYAFRGYLTQVFGAHFPTAVAVLAPAVLFALAHGAQDAPIFVDRLAFGIVAGILVVRTGGLEAGIAMHVLNNWLAFSLALMFSDFGSALNPTGGTWWSLPVTLTQSLVYLGLVLWVTRNMGVSRTADGAVLAASTSRV
ncbi:CPBP family intramembrane glutamic endopeptidase [Nocardioides sp. Root151]|uniref:CPBP family intramembrane glutamic endopeptidase n=1 Tax=Nocardioides sp. Root151 TaxID=1736475 RepID=UPI000703AAC0|nr:type II CAAX endopeptidase family protein [Nocardioides sp. Root151]KQZ69689.1 abortive infection protein [Nocardioides sp. Root151]